MEKGVANIAWLENLCKEHKIKFTGKVAEGYPAQVIIQYSRIIKADLIVIDRNISIGSEGALFSEVKGSIYGKSAAKVHGFIAGLGGKDVTFRDIETICKKAVKGKVADHQVWYGLEEV